MDVNISATLDSAMMLCEDVGHRLRGMRGLY
jgi:hypothetical protein